MVHSSGGHWNPGRGKNTQGIISFRMNNQSNRFELMAGLGGDPQVILSQNHPMTIAAFPNPPGKGVDVFPKCRKCGDFFFHVNLVFRGENPYL